MSTRVFTSLRLQGLDEVSVGFLRVSPRINAEKPLETSPALPKGYGHRHPAPEVLVVYTQIFGLYAHNKIWGLKI
jgi:hypothetical protein